MLLFISPKNADLIQELLRIGRQSVLQAYQDGRAEKFLFSLENQVEKEKLQAPYLQYLKDQSKEKALEQTPRTASSVTLDDDSRTTPRKNKKGKKKQVRGSPCGKGNKEKGSRN